MAAMVPPPPTHHVTSSPSLGFPVRQRSGSSGLDGPVFELYSPKFEQAAIVPHPTSSTRRSFRPSPLTAAAALSSRAMAAVLLWPGSTTAAAALDFAQTRVPDLVTGSRPRSTADGPGAILAFEHAYYMRSGDAARFGESTSTVEAAEVLRSLAAGWRDVASIVNGRARPSRVLVNSVGGVAIRLPACVVRGAEG
jgi:hypothetical protein